MKKILIAIAFMSCGIYTAEAQEGTQFQVITVVESIVPGGLGRSRLIESKSEVNVEDFTTERTDGKKSDQGSVKRKLMNLLKLSFLTSTVWWESIFRTSLLMTHLFHPN